MSPSLVRRLPSVVALVLAATVLHLCPAQPQPQPQPQQPSTIFLSSPASGGRPPSIRATSVSAGTPRRLDPSAVLGGGGGFMIGPDNAIVGTLVARNAAVVRGGGDSAAAAVVGSGKKNKKSKADAGSNNKENKGQQPSVKKSAAAPSTSSAAAGDGNLARSPSAPVAETAPVAAGTEGGSNKRKRNKKRLSTDPLGPRSASNKNKAKREECECKRGKQDFIVCSGPSCTRLPPGLFVPTGRLRVLRTNITDLAHAMFANLTNLVQLDVRNNPALVNVTPGAFEDLTSLGNLTLSFNNLTNFKPDAFRGLVNLEEMFLVQNGIKSLKEVATALRPEILPNLRHVHLGGNNFEEVKEDDLKPLSGSNVRDIQLMACNIKKVDAKALTQLTKLGRLRLRENPLQADNVVEVVRNLPKSLFALDISAVGLKADDMPKVFEALSGTLVTDLWLMKNSIPVLKPGAIPLSPSLRRLNMRDVGATQIEDGALANFTNLEELYLGGNKFTTLPLGALKSTLKALDLSLGGEGNETLKPRSNFDLGSSRFKHMSALNRLRLRGNGIVQLTKTTFSGLTNLTLLDLESCNIKSIEPSAFADLKSLETLILTRNDLSSVVSQSNPQASKVLSGLQALKTLRMDYCEIDNLHEDLLLAKNLPTVKGINLDGNKIATFSGGEFREMADLKFLGLAFNSITGWTLPIFAENAGPKTLILKDNNITLPTPSMIKDFGKVMSLNMRDNPVRCDCNSLGFLRWVREESNFQRLRLECAMPEEWAGKTIWEFYSSLDATVCRTKSPFYTDVLDNGVANRTGSSTSSTSSSRPTARPTSKSTDRTDDFADNEINVNVAGAPINAPKSSASHMVASTAPFLTFILMIAAAFAPCRGL